MTFDDEAIQDMLDRENITISPLDKRFFAFLIDFLLMGLLMSIIFFNDILSLSNSSDQLLGNIEQFQLLVFEGFVLRVVYHTLFVFLYGATLGKMICKIQVVSLVLLDSPSLLKSFCRALLLEFSQLLYFIPFIFMFSDQFNRTLYDRVCGTIVICQKK